MNPDEARQQGGKQFCDEKQHKSKSCGQCPVIVPWKWKQRRLVQIIFNKVTSSRLFIVPGWYYFFMLKHQFFQKFTGNNIISYTAKSKYLPILSRKWTADVMIGHWTPYQNQILTPTMLCNQLIITNPLVNL